MSYEACVKAVRERLARRPWQTVGELRVTTGYGTASVATACRDLFVNAEAERRKRPRPPAAGGRCEYEYRLVPDAAREAVRA